MGALFGISFWDIQRPLDYVWVTPGFTIAVTENGSYFFGFPSDVQFDTQDPISSAQYQELFADIDNIEIILTDEMLANTINKSNWIPGTVFIELHDEIMWTVGSFICDEEQSQIIRDLIASQDFTIGQLFFDTDTRLMFNGEEYLLCRATGNIQNTLGQPRHATLSAIDLEAINNIIS
jgi:hypothetical protein